MMWLWLTGASAMPLQAALQAAEQRSSLTVLSEQRVAEARAKRSETRSYLLPKASVTVGAVAQNKIEVNLADQLPDIPLIDPTALTPLVVQPGLQLRAAAEVSQPLVAPRAWSAGSAARVGLQLAEAEQTNTRMQLQKAVIQAWHRSAEAHALHTDAVAAVEQSQRLLQRGQVMVEAGVATADQILPFRQALAGAEAAEAGAGAGLQAADGVLEQLTGIEGGADLPTNVADQELPALSELLQGLDRPDLEVARVRVDAAQQAKKVERAGMYPTLGATAGVYTLTPAPDLAKQVNWKVQLGATVPLFQGGAVAARVSGARARVAQAEAALHQQQDQARIEIRSAHAELAIALASLHGREVALELAQQAVGASEERMDGGGGTLLEVQQAQAAVLQAQTELTRARASAAKARDLLELAASGRL